MAGLHAMPSRVGDAGVVPPPSTAAGPAKGDVPASAASRDAVVGTATPPPTEPAPAFEPTGVQLPSLGVDAAITPVVTGPDRLLGVPADVRTVGWWSGGAPAGATSGTVVLVGHVDSAAQGPGAFFQLRRLAPGDRIRLTGGGGRAATYTVVARQQYAKSALPAGLVFGQGNAARLVLVTCGGSFDTATRHYTDNVVVFAVPAG